MSSSTPNLCFNSSCKEVSDIWRRGWRRRTGDYAHLCDRCALVYEDGKFCETFHLNASGWRGCESCGKQIHCGCIVSFHMFVLLDAGGIECLTCAKKSYILTPNPAWPPPSHFLPSQPEKMDLSGKSCSTIAGSGTVPWHRASNKHCGSDNWSNAHPSVPFGIDASGSISWYHSCDRPSPASCEMRQQLSYRRLISGNLRLCPSEAPRSGNSGISMKEQSYTFPNDVKPEFLKNYSSSNLTSVPSSSRIETDDTPLSALLSQQQAISIPLGKPVNHSGMDSSGESQIRNGKVQVDARGRNQLLPRYRPHITNEELQQISSNSKSVIIIPLFEKMLSASDAGRIGRLVLPKKCAETYFPPIAQPEGLPLLVQDVKGKDWVFQFRFWPNNNSRMYVLEGITPCIQSMQLQAGDVVTFSRLEPEGKLVMGGRKASAIPSSDQGDEATVMGNGASILGDAVVRNNCGDLISVNGHMKDKILDDKPSIHMKRKNDSLGTKSKRFRFEEDMIELKLTCKEAQGLMRPPDEIVPSFVVVEGCEFEEFEEAEPIIGRPTLPWVDHFGEKIQWVQCEECFKWRKVPADALLPSRWICANNVWDLDRAKCSATEELAKEQLDHMLLALNKDSSEKEITDQDLDIDVPLEGHATLANLAIPDKGDDLPGSSGNRTKHPHKNSCTCIVCHQPPSGRGSKHKHSCDCIVCSSLGLRFKALMERQERMLSEREAEPSAQNSQKQQQQQSWEKVQDLNPCPSMNTLSLDEARNSRKPSHLPLKGHIDLNIQPEREEEYSPGSDSGPIKQRMAFLQMERPLDSDVMEI